MKVKDLKTVSIEELYELREIMPTIEWLKMQPDKVIRDKSINNYDEDFPFFEDEVNSYQDAILASFRWYDTDEGEDYWRDISNYNFGNNEVKAI